MKTKALLLAALSAAAFSACQTVLQPATVSQVSVNPQIVKVVTDGETKTVQLTANCDWETSSSAAWVTVAPASGSGSTSITIIAAANSGDARDATVTITASGASTHADLLVTQSGVQQVTPGPGPGPDPGPTPGGTTISNATQLAAFIEEAPTLAADEEWTIEADIDCGGAKIAPIASFSANLDGKNHKIYNFVVESSDSRAGLLLVNNGTIKNVIFGSSDGKAYDGKSSIGFAEGKTGEYAGLVAENAGTLENVANFATINYAATSEKPGDYIGAGGISGLASGAASFINCTNGAAINATGAVTQEVGLGGILGYTQSSDVKLVSCVNVANLTISIPVAKVIMIGGIAGRTNGTILVEKCENKGEIAYEQDTKPSTWMAIGGIGGVFYNGATVTECKNSGRISSNLQQVNRIAGILGTLNRGGTVEKCENSGEISLTQAEANANWQAAGGIVGSQEREDAAPAKVIGNTNTGAIKVNLAENNTGHQNRIAAGGIFGLGTLVTEVSGNTNKGSVNLVNGGNADSWAGGIVGAMVSTAADYPTALSGNVNSGAVSCKTGDDALSAAGGVIGNNGNYPGKTDNKSITVTGDKNTGAITCAAAGRVGSIAGINLGTLTNCVAGGSVNGTAISESNLGTLTQGASSSGKANGTTLAK